MLIIRQLRAKYRCYTFLHTKSRVRARNLFWVKIILIWITSSDFYVSLHPIIPFSNE